jgi:5-bromo-4-chloroindolyl phosphate hydrolysis protein
MAFINQSVPDIRGKLQKLERFGQKSLRDLVEIAEKMYHNLKKKKKKKLKIKRRLKHRRY